MEKINTIKINGSLFKAYNVGFKKLDDLLGGLKLGNIVTIGARPGMGKTKFCQNLVVNLLDKYNLPTLYVSMEASKSKMALELAAIVSEQNFCELKDNEEKANKALDELKGKNYNLYIADDCYYVDDIEKIILENSDIKCLVIDYFQLLDINKDVSVNDKYNSILSAIKKIAKKYNILVIMISQLSRSVEYRIYKRPQLVDLKLSGGLEEVSDIIIFLYRESYYNREIDNKIMEIIVSKNRDGAVGNTFLDYNEYKSKYIDY